MPLIPGFIERLVLLKLNQGPGLMLDFLGAEAFCAVCVDLTLAMPDIARRHIAWAKGSEEVMIDFLKCPFCRNKAW